MDEESCMKKLSFAGHPSSKKSSVAVGLRILIQISQRESNIVVKSSVRLNRPASPKHTLPSISPHESCFLKSCHLCTKKLSPDKDIYMYRGDQGFCSVECRNRQIVLDEMKEMENSTKKILASIRNRSTTSRCETRILQQEFRRRYRPLPHHKNEAIFL